LDFIKGIRKYSPRIISGSARGTKLFVPKEGTRPMADRVKSGLFSIIQNLIYKSNVLDLYAGTGALGIECLSRAAARATFVDNSRHALESIRKNLKRTGFSSLADIRHQRVGQYLKKHSNINNFERFDIIFFSPPHKDFEKRYISRSAPLLKTDGILIAEHHKKTHVKVKLGELIKVDERVYGITMLSFFKRK